VIKSLGAELPMLLQTTRVVWSSDRLLMGDVYCVQLKCWKSCGRRTNDWTANTENSATLLNVLVSILCCQCVQLIFVLSCLAVSLKDRFPSKELRERLGIDDIALVLQQNRPLNGCVCVCVVWLFVCFTASILCSLFLRCLDGHFSGEPESAATSRCTFRSTFSRSKHLGINVGNHVCV